MFLHTLLVICYLWYVILITFPEIRKDAFEQNMQEDSGWSWSMLIMSVSKGLKHCIFFSLDITLQKETQEGISPPAQSQEPLKPQENISRPIHHPLVLKTNFEEEEEEGDEQNG